MKTKRLPSWLLAGAFWGLGFEVLAQVPAAAPATTASPWPGRLLWMGLGLLLGGLLGYWWRASKSRRRQRSQHQHSTTEATSTSQTATSSQTTELRAQQDAQNWKQRCEELQRSNAELSQRNEELAAQLAKQQGLSEPAATKSAEAIAPTLAEPVATAELAPVEPTPPEPAPPLPAATRYGPVQETPFVEERKIVEVPLPQLALMLTINPQQPDQASFTLNPQVNQTMLIGDGLNRLQKFFDYDPPLGGRISAVAAATPGTLQRHADGWQVVARARLLIS